MREFVKSVLKSNGWLRFLYEPLRRLYRLWAIPRRRRLLKKNGPAVLQALAEVFRRRGIPAFAAYGTMLGLVREHGFIPHDEDIDIGVMPGEWTAPRLLRTLLEDEKGFRFLFAFKFRGKVTEFKMEYLGIPIDFFFYDETGTEFLSPLYFYVDGVEYPAANANSMKIVHTVKFEGIKWVPAFGGTFPVVANYDRALTALYGATWRIPDAGWHDGKRPHIEDVNEFGYCIPLEEAMALEG